MESTEIEEWREQAERLATARDRGDFDKARRIAGTMDALAGTELHRNVVAYLRATIEITRLLDTSNHDLLRRHLARARLHLEALDSEELAVRCALAEVGYFELLVSLSVISFPSEDRARAVLQARLTEWMRLRDQLAEEELTREGRLADEPCWKRRFFAGFSVPAFTQQLNVLLRRKPEVVLSPRELREILELEMGSALRRNHGDMESLMRSIFGSADAIEDFLGWRQKAGEQWLARHGAADLKLLFDGAVRLGLTVERYGEIRERAMAALCDAMFRGAELLVEWLHLEPSRPETRARLLAKTLGFVAETVYKPLLASFVEVTRAVSGRSNPLENMLGAVTREARYVWRGRDALLSSIIDQDLIEIRNAVHHSTEDVRGSTIVFGPQRPRADRAGLEMSFERLEAKAQEVCELIITMMHAWVYVDHPNGRDAPTAGQPSSTTQAGAMEQR